MGGGGGAAGRVDVEVGEEGGLSLYLLLYSSITFTLCVGKVKFPLSLYTTNPFRQLLPKEEDLPNRDLRKWKIFPNRKIKYLYQKARKSEAVYEESNCE